MSQFLFKIDKDAATEQDGKKVWSAIASTNKLDRDEDVLLPMGCMYENFMKNPVMLFIHGYKQLPVGVVKSLNATKDALIFTFTFNDTEIGKELEGMYSRGEMYAFSVGFSPIKYFEVDETTPMMIPVIYPNGTQDIMDISVYPVKPRRVFTDWELLEISPVPVPSNPEALILRAKENMICKAFEGVTNTGVKQLIADRIEHDAANALAILKSFLNDSEQTSVFDLNVIPYEKSASISENSWDSLQAKASFLKFATTGEEKEVVNWSKYSKGFFFVNAGKADCVTAYKGIHHEVIDGEIQLNEKGLYKATAEALKDKESFGEHYKGICEHLQAHFSDLGKSGFDFEKSYSDEELDQIKEKGFVEVVVETPEESPTYIVEVDEIKEFDFKEIKELTAKLTEFSELFGLKFRILSDTLDDVYACVKELKVIEKSTEHKNPVLEENPSELDTQINNIKELLNSFNK